MSPKMGYGRGDDMCGAVRDGDGAPCTLAYGHEPPHSYAGAAFTRAAEMIRTLTFCEPCGALLGIYRHRGSFAGVVHALLLIKDCPSCGPQLRDEHPLYSVEEFAAHVVAQKGSSRT